MAKKEKDTKKAKKVTLKKPKISTSFLVGGFRVLQYLFEGFVLYIAVAMTSMSLVPFIAAYFSSRANVVWYLAQINSINSAMSVGAQLVATWLLPVAFLLGMLFILEYKVFKAFHRWLKKGCDHTVERFKKRRESQNQNKEGVNE